MGLTGGLLKILGRKVRKPSGWSGKIYDALNPGGVFIVRPAVLTNGLRIGVYRSGFSTTDASIKAKILRADVADFMLTKLTDDTYIHKTLSLSY